MINLSKNPNFCFKLLRYFYFLLLTYVFIRCGAKNKNALHFFAKADFEKRIGFGKNPNFCFKLLRYFPLILVLLFSNLANASQQPRFLGSEKKFRTFVYNPNEVYRYLGHYTYQGFIEFEDGETVSTISMGDPSLWLFEHISNRLFLKPVGENNSETNMTVITNKRIYHFDLMAKEAKGIDDKDLIFVAKFSYPDEKDKNIVEFTKAPKSDQPDMRNLSEYNFNYQYTGEPSIAPVKVFDNGEFTYFQFPKKSAEIPAIFTVDSAGYESLVNFRSVADYIIVERTAAQFTLRSGSDIVCVYNSNMYINGKENSKFSTLNQNAAQNSNSSSGSGSNFQGIQGIPQGFTLPGLDSIPRRP
jgi:type IV secretion system protein VirB9